MPAATAALLAVGACSSGSGRSTPPPVPHASTTATPTPLGQPFTADPRHPPTGVDVTGSGNARVPATGTVTLADGWAVSYAWACPFGTAAASPGHVPLTVTVQGASDPPAPATGDSGTGEQAMPKGGAVSTEVTSTSPQCRWRVVVLGHVVP